MGVIGLKDSVTGDTLCDPKKPILLERITFPETVISMAAEPDSSAEKKKLEEALARLAKQDPTFAVWHSEETGQTIISGMGELHLEVLRNRLERDFNLKMRVHKPRVSYRETVTQAAEVDGEFTRTKDGETQYAKVRVRVEPFDGDEPIDVQNKVKPGELPAELMKVLTQALVESAQSGGKYGFPLMKVRFAAIDAKYKEGETTEDALRASAAQAVMKSIDAAEVGLLEPVMKLEVVTPSEFVGNIQADLNVRHAMIVGSEPRGDLTVISAEAPLANMFGYSNQVRSLSQGRASYSMEPLKYALAPPSLLGDMFG